MPDQGHPPGITAMRCCLHVVSRHPPDCTPAPIPTSSRRVRCARIARPKPDAQVLEYRVIRAARRVGEAGAGRRHGATLIWWFLMTLSQRASSLAM